MKQHLFSTRLLKEGRLNHGEDYGLVVAYLNFHLEAPELEEASDDRLKFPGPDLARDWHTKMSQMHWKLSRQVCGT